MTTPSETSPSRMNSTQAWVSYLSKVELPVLANTLRQINELTDSRNSTVNELANVILNDAQLTSQVLRLSNTVFYNQTRTQVSTVSRAITLIGFDAVKSMAISSLIVDSLRSPPPAAMPGQGDSRRGTGPLSDAQTHRARPGRSLYRRFADEHWGTGFLVLRNRAGQRT
ncbi:HDOD domain-containing protein [Marinobacter nauticus]|uniref:HDOD domain-containing protein n=1 Tax=Marinobacter nauticus TaxID=2743 RepID=UPI002E2AEF7D|nr:HDOD domain-containing protein [Marinobacter nauticus]